LSVADRIDPDVPLDPTFDARAHAGLLTFLDVAAAQPRPPRRVKAQTVGPLTLGVALVDAGLDAAVAFPLAGRVAGAWATALEQRVAAKLPDSVLVVFFDEPALGLWRGHDGPIEREIAIDLLSTTLATTSVRSGVHVCGHGDLRLALDAGPHILHFDVGALDLDDALWLARFLEGDSWIAWGAIPTHRPVGEHPQPLWTALLNTWCELTRRGCDPVRLRSQAIVAPACGLAGHGQSQAERAMLLAREIGNRVHDHAAATKLAIGA
jgi:methionine synthase II (cobalamin-independent)